MIFFIFNTERPVIINPGHCSVKCGSGIRLQTSVICEDKLTDDNELKTVCGSEIITEKISCQKDPCKASFGPWNEWTECSKTCLKTSNETSFKSRIRTCYSNDEKECSVGSMERQSCENVPLCPLIGNFNSTVSFINLQSVKINFR